MSVPAALAPMEPASMKRMPLFVTVILAGSAGSVIRRMNATRTPARMVLLVWMGTTTSHVSVSWATLEKAVKQVWMQDLFNWFMHSFIIQSCINAFICSSFIHALMHSFIHLHVLIHVFLVNSICQFTLLSFISVFVCSFIQFIRSFLYLFLLSIIDSFFHSFIHPFIHSFIPHQKGITCTDGSNYFPCQCDVGYTGQLCETGKAYFFLSFIHLFIHSIEFPF